MFNKAGAPTLGSYKGIVVISCLCIAPFIRMKCPVFCILIYLPLKSTLSDISVATPDCFGWPLSL
jgi:hypothetical protein